MVVGSLPRRVAWWLLACLVSTRLCSGQTPAAPPGPDRPFEAWVGLTAVGPRAAGSITTSFVPPLDSGTPTGAAGQTLWLDGRTTVGFEAGANYFLTRRVGVQLLFGYDRFDLGGQNGPYSVLLNYSAVLPPNTVPQSLTYQESLAWPDTAGQLRQLTLAFNGVARWALGERLTGSLSGGLSVFDVRGDAQSLGYTAGRVGGHGALFLDDYQVSFSLGPDHSLGFDLGGAVDLALTSRVSLVADVRYFNGGSLTPAVVVTGIANPSQVITQRSPSSIQQVLNPPPPSLSAARSRILIGVKIRR